MISFVLIVIARLLGIYTWILIARILITWIPNIDPYNPIIQTLFAITDPVLEPFRRLVPSMGGMDFSPLVVFLLITVIQRTLFSLAMGF